MKKKLCAFVLAVAMSVLVLTGCGSGGSSGTIPGDTQTPGGGGVSIRLLGATWEKDQDYTWLYYCAEVTNTNSENAGSSKITIMPAGTAEYTTGVAAGDTLRFSGVAYYRGSAPVNDSSVGLYIDTPAGGYSNRYNKVVRSSDLKITSNARSGQNKIVGTLVNNGDIEAQSVRVSVLFKKDGKYIGGNHAFVRNVQPNGGTANFEVEIYNNFQKPGVFDSYEVAAAIWS